MDIKNPGDESRVGRGTPGGRVAGYAQTHGPHGDSSNEDRAYFDNYDIDSWSP